MADTDWSQFTPVTEDGATDQTDWSQFEPIEPPKARTGFAVANDLVIEAANAAASGAGAIADFVLPGNTFSKNVDAFVKSGEASQSDVVKLAKQRLQTSLSEAPDWQAEVGAVVDYVLGNPALALAQGLGSFAGPGLAAAGVSAGAKAAGLGAQAAGRIGLGGSAAISGAMAGGDAAGSAYDMIAQADEAQLAQSAAWQELAAAGKAPTEIREELAQRAARAASVIPALIGGVTGAVGAERLVAGLGKSGGRLATGARSLVSEGIQEGIEEGATQYEAGRAAGAYDPTIDPTKGVAGAAALGAALGAGTGGTVGVLAAPSPRRKEAERQLAEGQTIDEISAAALELAGMQPELDTAITDYMARPSVPELGANAPELGTPAPTPEYADTTPMTRLQAQQRLAVLRDQNETSGREFAVVPHPSAEGAFAIEQAALPHYEIGGQQAEQAGPPRPNADDLATAPPARDIIAALKTEPFQRDATQKTVINTAAARLSAEDLALVHRAAQAPFSLSLEERNRLTTLNEGTKLSPQRVLENAAQSTGGTATMVDPASLPSARDVQRTAEGLEQLSRETHGLVERIGRIFNKQIVLFDSDTLAVDGFVQPGDANTIYLNVKAQKPHLVILGHEITHQMKSQLGHAYTAFEQVVRAGVDEKGLEKHKAEYGPTANIEELSADLMGNRFQEPEFWTEVFARVDQNLGPKAAVGVVQRLGALINRAVQSAKRAIYNSSIFQADDYITNLNDVRAAAKQALAEYAINRREAANAVDQRREQGGVQQERREGDEGRQAAEAGGGDRVRGPTPSTRREEGPARRPDVTIREKADGLGFEAFSPEGRRLGYLNDNLKRGQAAQLDENANVTITSVEPSERGKGVGRALYEAFFAKHEGRVQPSGKTTADAWKVWKRNYPDKVELFARQEAIRVLKGADEQMVLGNITDKDVAARVQELVSKNRKPTVQASTRRAAGDTRYQERARELLAATPLPGRSSVGYFTGAAPAPRLKTNFEIARYFTRKNRRYLPSWNTGAGRKAAVDVLRSEVLYALSQDGSAVGWYDRKVTAAFNLLSQLHPELKTNAEAKFAFTALLAITSNSTAVNENFDHAETLYNQWKSTGLWPREAAVKHKAARAITAHLQALGDMVQQHGWDRVREFMTAEATISEIEAFTGFTVPSELKSSKVHGGLAFGSKIGTFFNNLYGNYESVTMDRWFMRTVNRLRGNMLALPGVFTQNVTKYAETLPPGPERAEAENYATAYPEGSTVEEALRALPALRAAARAQNQVYAKSGYRDRTRANVLAKQVTEALELDQQTPMGGADRAALRGLMSALQTRLQSDGIDITIADLQAVLWYHEKDLFALLKGKRDTQASLLTEQEGLDGAEDYETAARALLAKRGGDQPARAGARRAGPARPGQRAAGPVEPDLFPELKASTRRALVNIGLNVNDGSKITADEATAALERHGVAVSEKAVHTSDTEPTLVAALDRPLTADEANAVSEELRQDAIAQRLPDGSGALYGPNAAAWGDYNPAFFLMPDGTKAADVPAQPGRLDGIEAYHFSQAARPTLTTSHYGTGLKGSARESIMEHPDQRVRERLSFYVNKGTGIRPEAGVGGVAHKVTLNNVYDSDADPLKLRGGNARVFESKVLDAGFDGYLTRLEGTQPGQVIMLGKQTFTPEVLGPRFKIDEAAVVPPKGGQIQASTRRVIPQTSGFKNWAGDARVVTLAEQTPFGQARFRSGESVVVEALHGTTADFTAFQSDKANVESDLGAGFYFTNTPEDAAANYASVNGPDLKIKIDMAAERIANDEDVSYDTAAPRAREQFIAHEGASMPVWVKFTNPAVLGGRNATFLEYAESYNEETDEYGAPEGLLRDFFDALRAIEDEGLYSDFDAERVIADLSENLEGGLMAEDVVQGARDSEGLMYANNDEGTLVSTEIVRQAFARIGFDGFIDMTVDRKFGTQRMRGQAMRGMTPETIHFVAFEPTQVKSATGNTGAFSPTNPDITASPRRQITGDSGRQYTPAQQAFFERVGRTVTKPTLEERIKALRHNLGARLAQGVADQFRPVKDLDKHAYLLMRLSRGSAGAIEAMLHHGKVSIDQDGVYNADTTGGFIERVATPLQGEIEDFLWWVASHRAERLAAEDRENLFTAADIAAGKALAAGTTDFDYVLRNGRTTRDRSLIYQDTLKSFDEFNKNAMDLAEQSGLIDPESRKFWEHEFYVPFYRVADDTGGFVGGNLKNGVVRQSAFKQLKGGKDKLNSDLLANTLQNWAHLIDASAKNRAARATLEAAARVGAATEADEKTVRQMARSAGLRQHTVWFMDGGKERHFIVEDPALLTAINGLEFAGLRGPLMNALSTAKHWLTVGVTINPAFKIKNLIRDSVQAVATAPLSYNIAANVREGFAASRRGTQPYVSALASGGIIRFGTMLEGSQSERVRQLVAQGVDKSTILDSEDKIAHVRHRMEQAFMAYQELGNRGEEINRMALFQQLQKQGFTRGEAALAARDLLDFSMQGAWTGVRFFTQVVPFMNARIQGLYKLGRASAEDKQRVAIVLAATSALSLLLWGLGQGDPDWEKREDWDRDNYWWFKFGGTAFRIPKPFEVGAVATLAEHGADLFFNPETTGKQTVKRVRDLLLDQLSMNPLPQAVKPVLDLYSNKDSFTGRPIETMGMERLRPDYRYTARTSMPARAISTAGQTVAETVGGNFLSPVQVDHMLRGYFGWLGSFAVGAADMVIRPATSEPTRPAADLYKLASLGLVSELPEPSSRYVTQLYEQAKELDQAHATWKALQKQGRGEEARAYLEENRDAIRRSKQFDQVKQRESVLNERIRMVERSTMDPAAKRAEIQRLQAQKNQLARRLAGRPAEE